MLSVSTQFYYPLSVTNVRRVLFSAATRMGMPVVLSGSVIQNGSTTKDPNVPRRSL